MNSTSKWYRRLQVQMWLWAIVPLVLVLAAFTFTGVYEHERSMRAFVAERDEAIATLHARQIDDGLAHGIVRLDGSGLSLIFHDGTIGQRGVIYVVDERGQVLFYPGLRHIGEDWRSYPAVRQSLRATSGSVNGHFADGSPTLASFASVVETGWRVVVEEPVSEVIVPILRFSSTLPALIAVAGGLSLLLAFFTLNTLVRPLQRLSEAAERITWGELGDLPADVGGVEEVRHLGQALEDMMLRIRGYQQSMRDHIAAIIQGQETERARLSRELHDETVQDWIASSHRLQLAEHALERGDTADAVATLAETRQLANSALEELRRLIRGLRPAYLEDLGLVPALQALVQEVEREGLTVETVVLGQPRRLAPEIELVAYRVAQEALANAAQHARARQIVLTASFDLGSFGLSVSDDGQGFAPPGAPETLTEQGHFGLLGMRERVLLVGGSLDIESQPGTGTRVLARFPLPAE